LIRKAQPSAKHVASDSTPIAYPHHEAETMPLVKPRDSGGSRRFCVRPASRHLFHCPGAVSGGSLLPGALRDSTLPCRPQMSCPGLIEHEDLLSIAGVLRNPKYGGDYVEP
jgi:hypothetical protein